MVPEWIRQRRLPWKLRWLKYIRLAQPVLSARVIAAELSGDPKAPSLMLQAFGAEFLGETLAAAKAAGMTPFLAFGTLLGHCRDGGFIKHDADIDLGILEPDRAKADRLVEEMRQAGYVVRQNDEHEVSFYKPHFPTLLVDFFVFYRKQDSLAYYDRRGAELYEYRFPAEVFAEFTPVRFGGQLDALIPARAEQFLEVSYGDWRTPRTAFDNVHGHPNRTVVEQGAGH